MTLLLNSKYNCLELKTKIFIIVEIISCYVKTICAHMGKYLCTRRDFFRDELPIIFDPPYRA
jgi:hypothetical protein